MTFIEMVRAVRSRVGMQGSDSPSSISGAVGAEIDIVNAVRDTWIDIQNSRQEWKWQRKTKSFFTVADDHDYTPAEILPIVSGTLDRWRTDATYYIDTNGKRVRVKYMDYDNYMARNVDTYVSSKPRVFTIRPWDNLIMMNPPDGVYTMYIDYQESLQELTTDTTVPDMPANYHILIVYGAVEKYGNTLGDGGIEAFFAQNYVALWGSLTRSQLPESKFKHMGGIA